MIKQDIVDSVSKKTGLTKLEVEAVINTSFKEIITSLSKNEKIELRGFGTFAVKHRLPKKARNPKTGEKVHTPEKKTIHFKMAKDLFKKLNNEKE